MTTVPLISLDALTTSDDRLLSMPIFIEHGQYRATTLIPRSIRGAGRAPARRRVPLRHRTAGETPGSIPGKARATRKAPGPPPTLIGREPDVGSRFGSERLLHSCSLVERATGGHRGSMQASIAVVRVITRFGGHIAGMHSETSWNG